MKKLLAIFFLLAYSLTSVGATMHMHYCMGKLQRVSFNLSQEKKCSNCGMEKAKTKGCCEDQQQQIKVSSDHQQADFSFDFSSSFAVAVLPVKQYYQQDVILPSVTTLLPFSTGPPDVPKCRLHILHSLFLI